MFYQHHCLPKFYRVSNLPDGTFSNYEEADNYLFSLLEHFYKRSAKMMQSPPDSIANVHSYCFINGYRIVAKARAILAEMAEPPYIPMTNTELDLGGGEFVTLTMVYSQNKVIIQSTRSNTRPNNRGEASPL